MRCHDVHLLGFGAALGELVPITSLRTRTRRHSAAAAGQRAVSVARGQSGPQLAVRAARHALDTSTLLTGSPAAPPDMLLHSSIWRGGKGVDFWNAATYVSHQLDLGAGRGLNAELNLMSNSMIGGLELAASILAGRPDHDTILLTSGDTFGAPAFPHLGTDIGTSYGDGGAAVILGRRPGAFAQLLAIASYSDPTLEALHRGDTGFSPPGSVELAAIDLVARKRAYLATTTTESVHRRNAVGVIESVKAATGEAGVPLDRISWAVLPHYGKDLLASQCLQPLGIPADRTLCTVGDQWGHMGAADQIAALTHLFTRRVVRSGEHVLVLGVGVGMTWTAAVLRIDNTDTDPAALARFAPPLLWSPQLRQKAG
ncbi:3-oxoacyl-[acyl-carrier-protein] synthase III C-terminal domain-containing protein [Amycolatopsis sp. CA-230715]|uniref:3-oxoacyl-[acyl-carrier-protein] synthase III C-terminal domain-containing protein n=1 Tax=Amycolatopsis sp. CA-230715 TaxID=2745196 RepID=UPI001C01CB47|nr:3-oxoacyl-[acyl-carrier-protein] synthase III C-terminal domain-containing protein [Amycolatopsis sp. CA-230715]QWF81002.1 hypothetical protein HUW46_04427 [Amycolatopsis sp. CA-230715]